MVQGIRVPKGLPLSDCLAETDYFQGTFLFQTNQILLVLVEVFQSLLFNHGCEPDLERQVDELHQIVDFGVRGSLHDIVRRMTDEREFRHILHTGEGSVGLPNCTKAVVDENYLALLKIHRLLEKRRGTEN